MSEQNSNEIQDAIAQHHASSTVFQTPAVADNTTKAVRDFAAAVLGDITTYVNDVQSGDPTAFDRLRELQQRLGRYAS